MAQTVVGRGPKWGEPYGDCLRASLCSILELPVAAMPHFVAEEDARGYDWISALNAWLRERYGLMLIYWPEAGWPTPPGYHLRDGITARGAHHSTVALDGVTVHDPHPEPSPLLSDIQHGVLVSVDAAVVQRLMEALK